MLYNQNAGMPEIEPEKSKMKQTLPYSHSPSTNLEPPINPNQLVVQSVERPSASLIP